MIAILLLAAGLGLGAWWMGRGSGDNAQASAPAVIVARPIPEKGWGPMRVMAANVRLDEPSDGENAWLKRRELLRKSLLKYQPEILACQEVSPIQGAYLNKELAAWYAYYPRAGVGRGAEGGGGGGGRAGGGTRSAASELLGMLGGSLASMNTIYYRSDRFDIVDGEAGLVLPNEPQSNPTENTFFTLAVLREKRAPAQGGGPGTVMVVDIHFRHVETFALRCAKALREKMDAWEVKYPKSGVLVLGDINRDRTTALYAALTAKGGGGAPEAVGGLVDLFDYAKKPANELWGTYHGFTGKTAQPWPTDLIFYGGALQVTRGAEIVPDAGVGGRYPTDHFLVQGEVGWRGVGN